MDMVTRQKNKHLEQFMVLFHELQVVYSYVCIYKKSFIFVSVEDIDNNVMKEKCN